jgi:SpoVK/Ycf46/Vps4 family AAA+-type ATPase
VLLATTNRLDALDPASIRRFDLKVAFELPGARELEALGRALCMHLGVEVPTSTTFARFVGLTTGDFAAVARQLRGVGVLNAEQVIDAIRSELLLKPKRPASVGFIQ